MMAAGSAFCSRCGKPLPPGAEYCASCGAPVSQQGASSSQVLSGLDALMKESAAQSYWVRRLIAFVVDAVVVSIAVGVLALIFAIPLFFFAGPAAFAAVLAGAYSFVVGIILVLYFTFAESLAGASFGKRIFELRVATADGRPPTPGEAFLRNISKVYWVLLLIDVVLGLATTKKYTQKFSDRYAGTEVVEAAWSARP